jgi:YVTN family beta-propeller protein
VFSPDGTKAYVGSSNMLQVINTATNTVIDTRILGFGPYGIAVSPDGDWVYVASWTGDYVKTAPATTSMSATALSG